MWNAGATGVRPRHPTSHRCTPPISAKRAARRAAGKRLRNWIAGGAVTIAVTAVLAVFAYLQSIEADRQRVTAEANAADAAAQRDIAETQRAEAVEGRNAALLNESRFLARMSAQMWEEGRAAEALALAVEALPDEADPDRPLSQEALRSLRNARLDLRETARAAGQDMISGAVFSPDGQWIATSDTEGGIVVRDSATGEIQERLDGHSPGFTDIVWGANSKFLLTGGADWTPRLWNAETGEKLTDVFGMRNIVSAVAVADDTSKIAASGFNGEIWIWDLRTGGAIGPLTPMATGATILEFTSGGKFLVGQGYGELRIWRAEDGADVAALTDQSDKVTAVGLRPTGTEIAVGRENGDIEIRTTEGRLLNDVTGQYGSAIVRLRYSPDGWTIAVTDLLASYAVLLRAEVGASVGALFGHESRLNDIAFSNDSDYVITGSEDGSARIWDAENLKEIASIGGHREGVNRVGFNPKTAQAYSLSRQGDLKLWRAPDQLIGRRFDDADWYALAVALTEDGGARAVRRGRADSWTMAGEPESDVEHDIDAATAAISPDGAQFAVGGEDGAVALFNFGQPAPVARTTVGLAPSALAFSGSGEVLIGLKTGEVLLWDAVGEPVQLAAGQGEVVEIRAGDDQFGVLRQGGYTVLSASGYVLSQSSPDAQSSFLGGIAPGLDRYAAMDVAGGVTMRDATGAVTRVIATSFKTFRMIRFSDDGAFLMVGAGEGGGMMIFDAETGAAVVRLRAHRDRVISADIRDGQLISGDHSGVVWLRPLYLDAAASIAEATAITDRLAPLSQAERCRFFLDPDEACEGIAR